MGNDSNGGTTKNAPFATINKGIARKNIGAGWCHGYHVASFQSKAKRQQAKLALNQSKNQAQNVAQEILLEESRMRNTVQFQLENIQTTAESLRLAEDIARKNEIKFKEGLISGFTLRQIQTQLYEAQNSYLNAMQQLVVSKTKLSLLLNPVTQTK